MEKDFSAHLNLIINGELIKIFSLSFRNRLFKGDLLTIDEIISGEMTYNKNKCNFDDDSLQAIRKSTIAVLKKHNVSTDSIFEISAVFLHPIVDFSADAIVSV